MTQPDHLRPRDQVPHRLWQAASGIWPNQSLRAGCDCGWTGHARPLLPDGHATVRDDLDTHLREFPDALDSCDDEAHRACGFRHHHQDDCPVPPTSPAGILRRAAVSGLADPNRALDRIWAITALRSWIEQTETEAVIAVALNRISWAQLAEAAGVSKQDAMARWAGQLDRYATAGVLPAMTDTEADN